MMYSRGIESTEPRRGGREDSRPLTALSLFCGAGGLDVGFADAGFQIVAANDSDPTACETYQANHPSTPVYVGAVDDHFGALMSYRGCDVVFGGPPCQGFSVAGKMDAEDARNTLIGRFFDIVDHVRPRAFVCENVKALAALSRWRGVRDGLVRRAHRAGYSVVLLVLNSADFGAPQARERMFLIGVQEDEPVADAGFDIRVHRSLEKFKANPPAIGDLIRSLGGAGASGNERQCTARVTFAKNPVLRRSPYAGMLFNGAGRPLDPTRWCSTLPASMGGNKTPIVDEQEIFNGDESYVRQYHAHLMNGGRPNSGQAPPRLRRLTVEECLAIQTFPTNYQLIGSQSAAYRQIGNAVPCTMAQAVASAVSELLGKALPDSSLAIGEEKPVRTAFEATPVISAAQRESTAFAS